MKFLHTLLFTLIALCYVHKSEAYTWGFTNNTDEAIVLYVKLLGWPEGFMNIVEPNERIRFSWLGGSWFAGYCLESVQWARHDPRLRVAVPGYGVVTHNGGLDMNIVPVAGFGNYPYNNGTSPMMGREHGWLAQRYEWSPVKITYVPDELYQAIVNSAAGIGTGIDEFLCSAIANIPTLNKMITGKDECPEMLSEIIKWVGGLVATSACRDREIEIIYDEDGEPMFIAPLK